MLDSVLAKDLSRFVAPEVAARISASERGLRAGEGEVREATVLFTDIEAFSTFAEKVSPERLVMLLNEYFEAVSGAVDRHGGVITQFQGDAMLITFNTVRDDPDHAAKAVRTALEIQELTRERLLYTVHGDEVNIAARLEQLNKKYGTYLLASESAGREEFARVRSRRIGYTPA